eukprot:969423-Amphidinium_carterae.2
MDTSTTTVLTTSDDSEVFHDSEEFHDCWSAVAQPAHVLPTQKKPKQKAKQPDKRVRFQADVPVPVTHTNVTREECLDFTPPTRFVASCSTT